MVTIAILGASSDDTCSSDDTGICGWVLDKTDNESAAKAANWLLGVPLAILAILVGAWLLRIVARWAIKRGTRRIMLPPEVLSDQPQLASNATQTAMMGAPLREARETFEREYLRVQIRRFSGNISRTATFIGMERSALHRKLKLLGLADNREDE